MIARVALVVFGLAVCSCRGSSPSGAGLSPTIDEMKAMVAQGRVANETFARDCPWPNWSGYAHATVVAQRGRTAALPPAVAKNWIDGCAVIRFAVDEDGNVVNAVTVRSQPDAVGVNALAFVQQNQFARGEKPDALFLVRIGFSRTSNGADSITTMLR